MICSECKSQGLKSKIYSLGSSTTLISFMQYYDEEGIWHSHDPNTHTQGYRCSNGHDWQKKFKWDCPAGDYGGPIDV